MGFVSGMERVTESNTQYYASEKPAKPFLKWAGGKGQLLNEIEKLYPFSDGTVTKYAEPFVGGGAVLFHVLSNFDLSEVYISDTNADLVNAYRVIRDMTYPLLDRLYQMQNDYLPMDTVSRSIYYLMCRERYNHLQNYVSDADRIEKAAIMIFLNKTCFNGLYRVNRKGLFNVPMGAYKNPLICDEGNLLAVSRKLRRVQIVCGDYKDSEPFLDAHTFVYFDPPYRPITETASFTAYTGDAFGDKEQMELAGFVHQIHKKGARIVISNSDPHNTDENDNFFDDLYASYRIKRVEATRMINCNSVARGKIYELLISNFGGGKTMPRDFDFWLSKFRESIADYGFYVDFEKVYGNVQTIRIELNILNSLIGSKSIDEDFRNLITQYPGVLKAIPILLAKREYDIFCQDVIDSRWYSFIKTDMSINTADDIEQYAYFMRKTGLFDLIQNHIISNLVDYVTGVETGLDSNGRKNRGGHLMENLVEGYIQKAGFVRDVDYYKEMTISQITERWGIDLSSISNQGKSEKRFDFVIKTEDMLYGIETNFYSSSGSKLNETARSYKSIALESRSIQGFTFVWFTDGKGWLSARNNLEETFDVMEHLYCIHDLENNVLLEVLRHAK